MSRTSGTHDLPGAGLARARLAIAVAAVAAHALSLAGSFTGDDVPAILDNRLVTGPLDLPRILTTNYWWGFAEQVDVLYRPVTVLAHHLVHALGGGAAWFHHAVNVALHAGVSLEVLGLAALLTGRAPAALAAGLLFAVHPLGSEPVNALVGRADLLAAWLGLLSFRFHRRAGAGGALAAASFLFLACLAKESALPVVAWLVGSDLVLRDRPTRAVAVRWVTLGLACGASLALRLHAVGSVGPTSLPPFSDNPLFHWSRASQLRTAFAIVSHSLARFAFPIRLSADYSFDQIPEALRWFEPRVVAGMAAVAGLGGLALDWRRPRLAVAAQLAALAYLPVSNLAVPMRTVTAERLLYLPMAGLVIAVAMAWARLAERKPSGARIAGLAACGLLAIRSADRCRDWHDPASLAHATVAASPRSWRAHAMEASALIAEGRAAQAEREYREVLRIDPRITDAARSLASLLAARGAFDDAAEVLGGAVGRAPGDAAAWLALARVESARGRDDAALAAFARTAELAGEVPSVRIGRAAIALRRGDPRAALAGVEGIVAERPDRADEVLPIVVDALLALGRVSDASAVVASWRPRDPAAAARDERLARAREAASAKSGPDSRGPGPAVRREIRSRRTPRLADGEERRAKPSRLGGGAPKTPFSGRGSGTDPRGSIRLGACRRAKRDSRQAPNGRHVTTDPPSRAAALPRLVVMAKQPRPGEVKTRLAPALGDAGAARLYAAFLDDLAARLGRLEGVERYLAVWPPDPDAAWLEPHRMRFTAVAQRGDGLGARMAAVVADALERDRRPGVVLVGSDAPTLPSELVEAGFAALASGADAVLGPNPDGGYYLIGLGRAVPAAFELPMSTPDVLAATRAALAAVGARVALLPPWHDVDVPSDLERLRLELADPAVARLAPRTARMLAELDAAVHR